LRVSNFRGIREGKIDGLASVNIFIGINNSGKSTVLEALYFLRASLNSKSVLGKSVLHELLQRRVRRQIPDMRELFYNYRIENQITIEASFDQNRVVLTNISAQGESIRYIFLLPQDKTSVMQIGFMNYGFDIPIDIHGQFSGMSSSPITSINAL
jgi:AAA15 family ATPase/GTPase